MKRYLNTFLLSLLLTTSAAMANGVTPSQQPEKKKNLLYCPPIKALTKDPSTQTWHVEKNWKSYDLSFVVQVKSFSGAQWQGGGANVGQITCIYHGMNEEAFPIELVFHTLTYEPNGGQWSKNLGGYKNCASRQRQIQPKDCPFKMRLRPQDMDVNSILEKLKSNN